MGKGIKRAAGGLGKGLFHAASVAALGIFGAVYFVALSFGSIAWMALALAPWLADPAKLGAHAGISGIWLLRAASLLACASFAALGRFISREAGPMTARARPGGSWAAIALMSWLAWLDCSLRMGREPPACLGEVGWVGHDLKGLGRLAWNMARGVMDLPRRSLAICWGVALIAAMPLGMHLAMAVWVPAAIMHIMFPSGPGSSFMGRARVIASDFAKEGSQEWAISERAELDKAIQASIDEREALEALASTKRVSKRRGRPEPSADGGSASGAASRIAASDLATPPERSKRL